MGIISILNLNAQITVFADRAFQLALLTHKQVLIKLDVQILRSAVSIRVDSNLKIFKSKLRNVTLAMIRSVYRHQFFSGGETAA